MFRTLRPAVLLALTIAVACTDQPTEPTTAVVPFQAVLGPPPADVAPLHGTLPAGTGGPAQIALGFWESPALARVTVSGLLTWSNPGTVDGYFPRPGGQLNYLGRYIPSLNLCASQLSVRVIGYGAVGGADGGCPGYWQTVASFTTYSIVSGQVVLARSAPALGACYYGGIGCTTLSGAQEATVAPVDGQLTIKLDTTRAYPGQLVGVHFGTAPVAEGGMLLPWSLREIRFEGSGPILGGGTPKGCESWYSSSFCGIRIYQSGYVVAEGMVSGKLRIQKQWIKVLGGDSLPPPPPPDSIPADTIPTDTIPDGGGGDGGGCLTTCPPPDSAILTPQVQVSRVSIRPVLSPCFSAQTQVARTWQCAAEDPRRDTVLVRIRASYSDDSSVAGLAITLHSVYSRAGSGHAHESGWGDDSLLVGHFIDLGMGLNDPSAGTRGSRRIIFNGHGDTTLVFRTSGVSGQEQIILIVDSATARTATKTIVPVNPDTLYILVDGLESLPSRTSIEQIGRTDRHPSNHWGTQEMNDLLGRLADSVAALSRRIDSLPPSKRPHGVYPARLGVNDMSLMTGGVFDIDTFPENAWTYPHVTHRDGQHADVDIRKSSDYDAVSDYVMGLWQEKWGLKFVDERQSSRHVHLANQVTYSAAPAGAPIRRFTAGVAICASVACSSPQGQSTLNALTSDTVTVAVDSVWRNGDKVAVAYHVLLGPEWRGRMLSFVVQPGVGLQSISSSAPDHWLDQKSTYEGRDVLEWTALAPEDRPTAGDARGGFVIEARALIGSVPYLIHRYDPPVLTSEDQLGDSIRIAPFWSRGSSGAVLGPTAPLPATTLDRATGLASDVTDWCSSDSAVPRGICGSLTNKAKAVKEAAATTSNTGLDQAARVFRAELDAQRGKHVSELVYWRLVADVLMVAP